MPRKFMYDGKELPDPDPEMSVDDVRQAHAEYFPELYNATHTEKKDGGDTVITFTRRVGTKGAGFRDFQIGDILKLNKEGRRGFPILAKKNARFKVVRLLPATSLNGQRIITCERLDLPSHARQTWGQLFMEKL